MEKDIDAKDKLKNLKIEVTCKNLEDQIKMLLDENNLINNQVMVFLGIILLLLNFFVFDQQ